jgi:quercetin 2,3-dioxygenase
MKSMLPPAASLSDSRTERASQPDGTQEEVDVASGALGEPVSGELRDALAAAHYSDGTPFPQFGDFPPGQAAPLPAPALPNTRMKPRG